MVQQTTPQEYYYGTGKRKTAIAKVRLYLGQGGLIEVNGKPLSEVFGRELWQSTVRQPLKVTNSEGRFNIVAQVQGGGVTGQSEALRHGISRALLVFDSNLRSTLRQFGLLTRDSRIKERKKYGLKKARRAPQYTKR